MTHLYQGIVTKYLGPTNVRGSRVKASCQARSLTIHWDDALNSEQNHTKAAQMLADLMQWDGAWYGGALPHSSGYAFVIAEDLPLFAIPPAARAS